MEANSLLTPMGKLEFTSSPSMGEGEGGGGQPD